MSCKNCWLQRSDLIRFAIMLMALVCAVPAVGQDYQKRLTDANKVYNDGNVEASCKEFQKLFAEKHEDQVKSLENAACSDMTLAYQTAERLFQDGMELKKQGKCEEAKAKLRQSPSGGQQSSNGTPITLKDYKHKEEVDKALAENCIANGRGGAGGGGGPVTGGTSPAVPQATSAADFVKQAQTELGGGNCQGALADIEAALKLKPGNAPAEALRKTIQKCVDEQPLRLGLKAFFLLRYEEANSRLAEYIDKQGARKDLALFFRGAVQGSRFLLSGERAIQYRDDAYRDFSALPAGFTAPKNLLSPKLIALYDQARSARSH